MRTRWKWVAVSLGIVLTCLVVSGFFLDKPLRGYLEQKVNQRLRGYTARLGSARLHLFNFSLHLKDLVITQDENPEPPVMAIPQLTASVQWRALLFGRVVADFVLERPAFYLNR